MQGRERICVWINNPIMNLSPMNVFQVFLMLLCIPSLPLRVNLVFCCAGQLSWETVLTESLSSSSLILLSSDIGPDIPSPLFSKGLMLRGKTGVILIHVEVTQNEPLLSSGLFHAVSTNPPNYPERCVSIFKWGSNLREAKWPPQEFVASKG